MTFGEMIRTARIAKGLSMRGLANTLEVSATFVHDVERDRAVLSDEKAARVAELLGIEFEALQDARGLTRELSRWLHENPAVVRLLRFARRTQQPLRVGACRCGKDTE